MRKGTLYNHYANNVHGYPRWRNGCYSNVITGSIVNAYLNTVNTISHSACYSIKCGRAPYTKLTKVISAGTRCGEFCDMHVITQAEQLVGKSRATIYRDIEKGLVSADVDERGFKVIAVSELERFYGTLKMPVETHCESQVDKMEQDEKQVTTADDTLLVTEVLRDSSHFIDITTGTSCST